MLHEHRLLWTHCNLLVVNTSGRIPQGLTPNLAKYL